MKAFVTSIGEQTTELCKWSLERNGFEVVVLQDSTSLAQKLKHIYENETKDFLRVDADVIVNRHMKPDIEVDPDIWWVQFQCFCWYKQNVSNGGIQFIKKEALPILRSHIDEAMNLDRPETYVYRLAEFSNPRRCITQEGIMGIHGYSQTNTDRVKGIKARRNQLQDYDFELTQKLNEL